MRRFVRDNGLSLFFLALFLLALAGQSIAGYNLYNQEQVAHEAPTIGYLRYLVSSDFGANVLENWQSEFLQVFVFIVLTTFLVHRRSHESPDTDYETEAALRRIEAKVDELERRVAGR